MNFANRDHLTKETYKLHISHGGRAHMQNRVTTNPGRFLDFLRISPQHLHVHLNVSVRI